MVWKRASFVVTSVGTGAFVLLIFIGVVDDMDLC